MLDGMRRQRAAYVRVPTAPCTCSSISWGDAHEVELDGLPAPDVSSCLPPLVVKSVSEASCVRFLSSSAIVPRYTW